MEEHNRNKGGRPVKAVRLTKRFKVSLSEEDAANCMEKAKSFNLTISGYIREMLLKGRVVDVFSPEIKSEKKRLTGMANNLNQLVKEAHTYGLVSMENEAKKMLSEIREILDNYKLKKTKL